MMTAKAVSEMSVSELLEDDRETGNILDAAHPVLERPYLTVLLRCRREIRAELNRRHELETQCVKQ